VGSRAAGARAVAAVAGVQVAVRAVGSTLAVEVRAAAAARLGLPVEAGGADVSEGAVSVGVASIGAESHRRAAAGCGIPGQAAVGLVQVVAARAIRVVAALRALVLGVADVAPEAVEAREAADVGSTHPAVPVAERAVPAPLRKTGLRFGHAERSGWQIAKLASRTVGIENAAAAAHRLAAAAPVGRVADSVGPAAPKTAVDPAVGFEPSTGL